MMFNGLFYPLNIIFGFVIGKMESGRRFSFFVLVITFHEKPQRIKDEFFPFFILRSGLHAAVKVTEEKAEQGTP